jgi:hypothetical protein
MANNHFAAKESGVPQELSCVISSISARMEAPKKAVR